MLTDLVKPNEIIASIGETLYMVSISALISVILGIIIGVVLYVLSPNGLHPQRIVYSILSFIVNTVRSFPFLVLAMFLIPFTMVIVGVFDRPTFMGNTASIIPLTIASTPFVAKIVENALNEIAPGMIEAGKSLGMSSMKIITKIILREGLPAIVSGITLAIISLIGLSAIVISWGGGGLGSLAYKYGFVQSDRASMAIIVVVIVALVQVIQLVGNGLYKLLK